MPEVTLRTIENRRFMLDTMAHRRLSANTVCGILAQVEDPLRREIVAEVVNKLGPGPFKPKELYLSRSELEELASQPGVEIGSHTLSHPNLTLLSDSKLRAELEESRSILSQIVGYEIRHLSYPNNAWDERVADMAKACGYSSATATARGRQADLFALPRTNLGWWDDAEFSVRTSGLWP